LLHREDLTEGGTTAYAVHMHSDFSTCCLEAAFKYIFRRGITFDYSKFV